MACPARASHLTLPSAIRARAQLTVPTLEARGGANFAHVAAAQAATGVAAAADPVDADPADASDPVGRVLDAHVAALDAVDAPPPPPATAAGGVPVAALPTFFVSKELTCYAPLDHARFDAFAPHDSYF